MLVKIDVDAWERNTLQAKEQFGDWASEGGISGVRASQARLGHDRHQVYELDVAVGGYVFAVVAHYSTGDSFGHCSGGQFQVVGAYMTPEKADEVKSLCELYTQDKGAYESKARELQGLEKLPVGKRLSLPLVIDGAEVYPYWDGYFESLNEIKVWLCRVEP